MLTQENSTIASHDPLPESYTIVADRSLLMDFGAAAEEQLGEIESIVLSRQDGWSPEHIETLFRAVHNLKATADFLHLLEIQHSSHLLESLLDETRRGERKFASDLAQLMLWYVDLERSLLQRARAAVEADYVIKRTEGTARFIERLARVKANKLVSTAAPVTDTSEAAFPTNGAESKSPWHEGLRYRKIDPSRLGEAIDLVTEIQAGAKALVSRSREISHADSELNLLLAEIESRADRLEQLGMSMHLEPVRALFKKIARVVWDMSEKLEKTVELHVSGEEVELNRMVLEKLTEPLIHLVRNAVDHGIESPHERERGGKDKAGKLELHARTNQREVTIEVRDDGRGLNLERIKQRAGELGIIASDQELSREEIIELIFHPGMSTAQTVTDISGRGVGMDVVRETALSLSGNVKVDTGNGRGTVVTITLPRVLSKKNVRS